MFLERLNKITITELKTNLLPRIILSFFIILFAKVLYGFNNLNEIESLLPLERFIPLIGLTLLMPILEPELDYNVYQVVKTREVSLVFVYVIRLIIALVIYFLFIMGTLHFMDRNNCMINYKTYFLQTLSSGIYLGSIGFMFIAITQNEIYAILISISYYLVNWFVNYKKLGYFYIFRLSKNLSPLNEFKLLLSAMFIIIGLIRYSRRKS